MNLSEYVKFYGQSFSLVQSLFHITKKSIFINFIRNQFFRKLQKIAGASGAARVALLKGRRRRRRVQPDIITCGA